MIISAWGMFQSAGYGQITAPSLHDMIRATRMPTVEVHLSNVHAREDFRQHSYLSDVARGVISGLGAKGYEYALSFAMDALEA